MNLNLVIYGKLTDKNTIISKGNLIKINDENNKVIAVAVKENRIYKMQSILKYERAFVNSAEHNNNMSQKERWHSVRTYKFWISKYIEEKLLKGIPNEIESEFIKCKTCIENKMHNAPFNNNRSRAKDIQEIIHTDVCGPFKTTGLNV